MSTLAQKSVLIEQHKHWLRVADEHEKDARDCRAYAASLLDEIFSPGDRVFTRDCYGLKRPGWVVVGRVGDEFECVGYIQGMIGHKQRFRWDKIEKEETSPHDPR